MSKMMQNVTHLHEVARLASLECANHHNIFQPSTKGNILIASHIVGNHHGSCLNAKTSSRSTKLLCAMQQSLSSALFHAGDSELGNPRRHHRTRYTEHSTSNRTVSCAFQSSLSDSLQRSIIAS